ncbi:MAG: DNA methyltransferase [Planctomycetota bacterium]|jgi:hypothetical protein|nr:DNA methyltransferase [Planctomycetota bacterium]MDP7249617.1 DNA methyltransferase [Planctomycetota bacterium]
MTQLKLFDTEPRSEARPGQLIEFIRNFSEFGQSTIELTTEYLFEGHEHSVVTFVNEFWTSRQRQAHSLHEVSYRACFKPQLPRFFITALTAPGDFVYDPFMGRGTALLESALMGRIPSGCDVNPLSQILLKPRLCPPSLNEIQPRLESFDLRPAGKLPEELLVFYHPDTLGQICALKDCLLHRQGNDQLDAIDAWIRMVAVNRLTGHSPGFFSVYTLPPNQAVSVKSQIRINERRQQTPPRRNVVELILRKSRSLLKSLDTESEGALMGTSDHSILLTGNSSSTPEIPSESVALVVTSPPFLDVVNYAGDNWLRCWFCGIDAESVPISICRDIEEWQQTMTRVFVELARILRPGGHVAFEVGEVRKGKIKLEEAVLPCGMHAGLSPELVLINAQEFTKTAHCWGVDNQSKGTNTNRIVLFKKI